MLNKLIKKKLKLFIDREKAKQISKNIKNSIKD